MKVDYSKIMEGDIWFSGKSYITECGFIIKPFGGRLYYAAHIDEVGKVRFDRIPDLDIVLIRRIPFKYDSTEERLKFRNRLIKLHEELIIEDMQYFGDSTAMVDSEVYGYDNYSVERELDFYVNNYRLITVQDGRQ